MFGSLRILLAIGVALSHVGITIFGYNLGVASVVAFYLISGYVTSHLLDTQLKTPSDYYWERSLRLLPSYWGALGIAALIWLILRPENSLFLQRAPDWIDWLSNITVISLNFYMWSGQDQFMPIPTAWSLAAELQFYLLAPWILMLNQRNRFIVTLASLLVWVAAQTGFLQTDWWGYRLLPGILLMFLMGACVLRHERWMLGLVWLTAAIVFCAIMAGLIGAQPYNVETSVGLLLGIPILMLLSRLSRRGWDDFFGRLAYPFFLLHFPMLWVWQAAGYPATALLNQPTILLAWLASTLAASWLLFLICELPLTHYRHSLRRRSRVVH